MAFDDVSVVNSGVGGKSVRQADVSGGSHFPRKFCPTRQDILSASRVIYPGLGGKSVRRENVSGPDSILALHSYKSSYEPTCQKLIGRGVTCMQLCIYYMMPYI